MAKADMQNLLKRRMAATQQASDLAVTDQMYHKLFADAPLPALSTITDLPLEKLVPFQTAEIGFRPYPPAQLEALSQQLQEDGLMVRIIVRPRSDGTYEILAGHNRTNAARLAGWSTIPAEIVEADDARAIVIATSTNLIQRQRLSILERGHAYKALLDAKKRQGFRSDQVDNTSGEFHQKSAEDDDATSGKIRQKYSARTLVAEFFGVTEHEIRKAIKLTRLIPELQTMLEEKPKKPVAGFNAPSCFNSSKPANRPRWSCSSSVPHGIALRLSMLAPIVLPSKIWSLTGNGLPPICSNSTATQRSRNSSSHFSNNIVHSILRPDAVCVGPLLYPFYDTKETIPWKTPLHCPPFPPLMTALPSVISIWGCYWKTAVPIWPS